jgi:hypothetical protein
VNRQCYEVLSAIEKFRERVKDVPEELDSALSAATTALKDGLGEKAGKPEGDSDEKPKSFDDAKESVKAKFAKKDDEDKSKDDDE